MFCLMQLNARTLFYDHPYFETHSAYVSRLKYTFFPVMTFQLSFSNKPLKGIWGFGKAVSTLYILLKVSIHIKSWKPVWQRK